VATDLFLRAFKAHGADVDALEARLREGARSVKGRAYPHLA
jgi:hypothetical protein